MSRHEDPWAPISRATVHARREATFLVLAATFLVTTTALLTLGTSRIIDLDDVVSTVVPDLELTVWMLLPIGVLAYGLGVLALALVTELYGRRRAMTLVCVGLFASLALVGLMHVSDRVGGQEDGFGPALAFTSCFIVGHLASVLIAGEFRGRPHLWLRLISVTLVAQLAAWATFALVMYGYMDRVAQPDPAKIIALATAAAAFTMLCVVLAAAPFAIVTRVLVEYLRVEAPRSVDEQRRRPRAEPAEPAHRRPLPPAQIIEADPPAAIVVEPADASADEPIVLPRRRQARASIPPYSSAEMRFFTEGDQLESAAD